MFPTAVPNAGGWYKAVMETLRLRALQQPVHAERLLEALATRTNIIPKNSFRICDPDALPVTLQRVMFNAAQEGCIWVCWARGSHSWLFTCETRDPTSPERPAVVLRVKVYGEDGDLMEAGDWTLAADGKWDRCAA
jgi:hypothetical protein